MKDLFLIYLILYIWSLIIFIKFYVKDRIDEYLIVNGSENLHNDIFKIWEKRDLDAFVIIPFLNIIIFPLLFIHEFNEIKKCILNKKDYL